MMLTVARVTAFTIALLAVADPSITASRSSRPVVAIVSGTSGRQDALRDRVYRALEKRFTVVKGAMPSAATIFVGDALPDDRESITSPLLAVVTAPATQSVRIISVDAPATSAVNARTPVHASVIVTGTRGSLVAEFFAGRTLVERQVQAIMADSVKADVSFQAIPAVPGAAMYRVVARIGGTSLADSATAVLEARETRIPVLFFDLRASWLSTFVRRAVEEDPRFAITHRVQTSRGLSNTEGDTPLSLRDARLLERYSTIVVGAPDQLSDADVSGLETFLRGRGGRVLLLMDERRAGPVDRLTGVTQWRAVRLPSVDTLSDTRHQLFHAQEIAWPVLLPSSATVHATSVARGDSTKRGVVWSVPVGAGRLMVSGALDAWHYRDASSGFDDFWTSNIADLGAGAPEPITISLSRRSVAPGEGTALNVWVRGAALASVPTQSTRVSARLIGDRDTTIVRLWPQESPGSYSARLIAPRERGTYQVVVTSGTDRAEAAMIVESAAQEAAADERPLIDAFVSSRGGAVIPERDLARLPRQVASAIQSVSRVETWHPMRSAWWIVPFALLLGTEWWGRRRRGLA